MNDGKQEVQILHSWLWVIIPVNRYYVTFAGYCKQCQNTYTELLEVPHNPGKGILKKSQVPKWGCINPMEGL